MVILGNMFIDSTCSKHKGMGINSSMTFYCATLTRVWLRMRETYKLGGFPFEFLCRWFPFGFLSDPKRGHQAPGHCPATPGGRDETNLKRTGSMVPQSLGTPPFRRFLRRNYKENYILLFTLLFFFSGGSPLRAFYSILKYPHGS